MGVDSARLSVSDVTKRYTHGEADVTAVRGVSLEIDSNEVVGILGPNGAGKTTLIKTILGVLRPTEGTVEINGLDVHEKQRRTYELVSAMFEGSRNSYWRLSVEENLRFFTSLNGKNPKERTDRYDELLEELDIEDKRDETVNKLSRGMKQKVCLACTLARETPLVFLDEPTLGLDVEASEHLKTELRRLVDSENRTIVLSSHDMDLIEEICDRVIIMNEGRIVADDSVEALIDVFRTESYELEVSGLTSQQQARLEREFPVDAVERNGDSTVFEATFDDVAGKDRLVERLVGDGASIERLEPVEPDLKEIFIEVAGEESEEQAEVVAR